MQTIQAIRALPIARSLPSNCLARLAQAVERAIQGEASDDDWRHIDAWELHGLVEQGQDARKETIS